MQTLLPAIQTALREGLDGFRAGDIYIARHESVIPVTVRPPCIGIKDGAISWADAAGGVREKTLRVLLAIYLPFTQAGEAAILGDSKNAGILAVARAIHDVLDHNTLAIGGMIDADPEEETPSDLFGDDTMLLQSKSIIYKYIQEETA